MRIRTASLLFTVATGLLFGCKKSDSVIAADSCQLAGTRAQAYANAMKDYYITKTPTNCAAFKTAANAYIDALAGCPTAPKGATDAAKASLADATC